MRRPLALFLCSALSLAPAVRPAPGDDAGPVPLSFGRVAIDRPLQQSIAFDNPSGHEIGIARIRLTPPLVATDWTRTIAPGTRGSFTFRLGEPRRAGLFEGTILVEFTDPTVPPLVFEISGTLVPPVEVVPGAAVFVATERGQTASASVEIVNHRDRPLRLAAPPADDPRRTLRVETLEPGRRYRLTATMTGQGEAGERTERVVLPTGEPGVDVGVELHTLLHEPVYTFPDEVYFGALPSGQVRDPGIAPRLAQTLMVYRKQTHGFEVEAESDLPFLHVTAERGPDGDRWELTLWLDPETTPVGEIAGTLRLTTNDERFPHLEVPVRGSVLAPR